MSSALTRPTAASNGTRSRGAKNAWRGVMPCSCSVRHEVAMRGASRRPPRFSSIASASARREPAHARLVVADRQQRHERAPVGALEADAALVERAVDRDAVGQRRADVDDQLERVARADGRVREHAVVEQLHAVDRADQLARQRRERRAPG